MLGYFKPQDPIFAKDYKYKKEVEVPIEPIIDNHDELFNNLPPLNEKEMRSTNRMRLPKEMTLGMKMAKLDRRQE